MTQYATIMPQLTGGVGGWCWDSSPGEAAGTGSRHPTPQRYSDTDPWKHKGLLMTAVQLTRLVHRDDKRYLRSYAKPVNYYDNYLVSKGSAPDSSLQRDQQTNISKPQTPSASQSTKQLCAFPCELLQHRSMIELDPCPSTLRDRKAVSRKQSSMSSLQAVSEHQWVCQPYSSCFPNHTENPFTNSPPTFTRFTIQELMQQEGCVSPTHYPVDYPSRVVRVECCKPGCRCVLKNESALALKIVPGVTLIRSYWLPTEGDIMQPSIPNITSTTGSARRSYFTDKQQQHSQQRGSGSCYSGAPMIISSCFPGWFEVAAPARHVKSDSVPTALPVWSSCKAIWRAKPDMFLLNRDTTCHFALSPEEYEGPVKGSVKADQLTVSLCGDRPASLPSGTVLRPIDCRLCRLSSVDQQSTSRRQRGKTVSMLQCAVVGGRALASLSASLGDSLQPQDPLNWFKEGPRLVYLPWDVKSMQCSPVVSAVRNSTPLPVKQSTQKVASDMQSGVHSVLSLLCQYQFPLTVHPILGFLPNELNSIGKPIRKPDDSNSYISSGSLQNNSGKSSLHMEACFHGDLIFLEPIQTSFGEDRKSSALSSSSGGASVENNQFFVVTTDMLTNHKFLIAEPTSQPEFMRQLKAHAFRVAHFLCTPHPAEGLAYLVKHLEDITHSCSTGPSHTPLTRTLGPVNAYSSPGQVTPSRAPVCLDVVASLAAAAEIAQQDFEEAGDALAHTREAAGIGSALGEQYMSTSCLMRPRQQATRSSFSSLLESEADQMNTLCDELEDIYYYVRNGRFPTESRSLTTLAHQSSVSVPQLEPTTGATGLLPKLPQMSAEDQPRGMQFTGSVNPVNAVAPATLYSGVPVLKGFATTHLATGQYRGNQVSQVNSNKDLPQDFTASQSGAFVIPREGYHKAGHPSTMASSHQPVIISNGRGVTRLYTNTKTLKLTPATSLHKPQPVMDTAQPPASSVNARLVAVPGVQISVTKPSQPSCRGACLGGTTMSHAQWLPATPSQSQPPRWIMDQFMNEQLTRLSEPKQSRDTEQRMHLANLLDKLNVVDCRAPGHSSPSVRQLLNPSSTTTVNQHHQSNEQLSNSTTEKGGKKTFRQINPRSGILHLVPSAMPYYSGRDQGTMAMNAVLVGSSPSHPVSSAFHLIPGQPETTNLNAYRPQQPMLHSVSPMTKTRNLLPTATGRTVDYGLQATAQTSFRRATTGSGTDYVVGKYTTQKTYLYTTPQATNTGCPSRYSDEHAQSGIAWTEHFTSSSPDTGIGVDSGGEMGCPTFGNPWQPKPKFDRLFSAEQ